MAHISPERSTSNKSAFSEHTQESIVLPLYAEEDSSQRTIGVLSWKPGPDYRGLEIDVRYLEKLIKDLQIDYGIELRLFHLQDVTFPLGDLYAGGKISKRRAKEIALKSTRLIVRKDGQSKHCIYIDMQILRLSSKTSDVCLGDLVEHALYSKLLDLGWQKFQNINDIEILTFFVWASVLVLTLSIQTVSANFSEHISENMLVLVSFAEITSVLVSYLREQTKSKHIGQQNTFSAAFLETFASQKNMATVIKFAGWWEQIEILHHAKLQASSRLEKNVGKKKLIYETVAVSTNE